MKASLKGIKTHAAKSVFNKEWAASRAVEVQKELRRFVFLTIDDAQEGEMMTLKKLAVELGNDLPAAISWAKSCLKLGPSEFEMNARTSFG